MLPEGCVIGGFISKIINDVVDISKHKIKEADKNRSRKNHNIQTRIYQVIIDAINELTYNKHKGQDELYDVAETLLNGFKRENINRIGSVKNGLKILNPLIDNNTCERFIEILRCEIEKEENFDLYKEILLVLLKDAAKYNQSELQQIKLHLEQINEKLDKSEKNIQNQNTSIRKKIKSRTQEYADKWNANMFLNDFDKRDENAGVNVKLKDVYLEEYLPCYIWRKNKRVSFDLKTLLIEYLETTDENNMLFIMGQPGIGKSTLITWIISYFDEWMKDILVYQFASDLKDVDWVQYNISQRILEKLGISYNDLNGKILIIDGYDEIKVKSGRRDILDRLYWDIINNNTIQNFLLIITCRVNYVEEFERVKCKCITLQPWNKRQIEGFCKTFCIVTSMKLAEKTLENILSNKEILGVPLILYMVLSLNISLEKQGSIVDIYDKIFSLDGGIYDRCIVNKSFSDKHRIGEVKDEIHQISREIALWMFENEPSETFIPQKEYHRICNDIIKSHIGESIDLERDFMIGNFLNLKHCEKNKGEEISFVHRSIYEYFVVEYIFDSICDVINSPKEDLASTFGKLLKGNILSLNMLEYMKIKILNSELKEKFNIVNAAFQLMLKDGMIYYTGICYKNVIHCEMNVFTNMLEILHLWENEHIKINDMFCKYLKYNSRLKLNLKEVVSDNIKKDSQNEKINLLKGVLLEGVYLRNADLSQAKLPYAYLKDADLREAYMCFADISHANLSGANLTKANLIQADLRYTNFENTNLMGTKLEASRWLHSGLLEVLSQLRDSNFNYIIVEDQEQKKVYKSELFLGKG